jgi:hypothetical protein
VAFIVMAVFASATRTGRHIISGLPANPKLWPTPAAIQRLWAIARTDVMNDP